MVIVECHAVIGHCSALRGKWGPNTPGHAFAFASQAVLGRPAYLQLPAQLQSCIRCQSRMLTPLVRSTRRTVREVRSAARGTTSAGRNPHCCAFTQEASTTSSAVNSMPAGSRRSRVSRGAAAAIQGGA